MKFHLDSAFAYHAKWIAARKLDITACDVEDAIIGMSHSSTARTPITSSNDDPDSRQLAMFFY